MPNSYTDRLKLRIPTKGDSDWDDENSQDHQMVSTILSCVLAGNVVQDGLLVSAGSGLSVDYTAGVVLVGGSLYPVASGNIAVSASSINYIYVNSSGVVSTATSPPTGNYVFLGVADTDVSSVLRVSDSRVVVPATIRSGKIQTVLTGSVDSNGYANFLGPGTGLAVGLDAAADNIQISFATGYGVGGTVGLGGTISADVTSAWSGLTEYSTEFLYVDRNITTGALTYGQATNLPPVYGTTYNKSGGVGKSLLHFTGADSSTTITDENSSITWTAQGLADIQSNQLNLANATDYVTQTGLTFHAGENEGGFSWEGKIYLDSVGATQYIFGTSTSFHAILGVNVSGNLILYLGNGSSWSIANGTTGTAVLSALTTYYIKLQWDGAAYKVYLGTSGTCTEDISVESSVAFAKTVDEFRLGAATNSLLGNMDEVRYNVGPQTNTAPTVPTADYKGLAMDGEHWFNRNTMKMTVWNDTTGAWDEKQRVFVGEAVCGASSVESFDPASGDSKCYALRGEYDSGRFTIATNTLYEKDHNIGCTPEKFTALGAEGESYGLKEFTNIDSNTTSVRLGAWVEDTLRNSINLYTGITGAHVGQTVQVATQARIRASRGW